MREVFLSSRNMLMRHLALVLLSKATKNKSLSLWKLAWSRQMDRNIGFDPTPLLNKLSSSESLRTLASLRWRNQNPNHLGRCGLWTTWDIFTTRLSACRIIGVYWMFPSPSARQLLKHPFGVLFSQPLNCRSKRRSWKWRPGRGKGTGK